MSNPSDPEIAFQLYILYKCTVLKDTCAGRWNSALFLMQKIRNKINQLETKLIQHSISIWWNNK